MVVAKGFIIKLTMLSTKCRYMDIVTYKTAYYSFFLPVACGMHLAGTPAGSAFETAQNILVKMGQYFQIQDDYLDCYADASVLGKVGTDIQDNKCSWLVCTALVDASPAQRATIAEHYGKDDEDSIANIKAVYQCALIRPLRVLMTAHIGL